MSRPTTTRRRRTVRSAVAPVAVGLVGALALSSCSVSSPDLSAGTAAEVGSTSISLNEVDDAAQGVCASLDRVADQSTDGQTPPQRFPGGEVRTSMLEGLVLRELGDRLRDDLDVSPSAAYGEQVAQARSFLASSPVPADDVVPALTGAAYYTDLVIEVGRIALGLDEVTPEMQQQALTAGLPIVEGRIGDTTITTNPIFPRLRLAEDPVQGQSLVFFDRDSSAQDLSVPVSDQASAGQAAGDAGLGAADPSFLASLPDSQVCG